MKWSVLFSLSAYASQLNTRAAFLQTLNCIGFGRGLLYKTCTYRVFQVKLCALFSLGLNLLDKNVFKTENLHVFFWKVAYLI